MYYEKAITAASDAFYKAANLRGYGRVLIRAGHVEDGRGKFDEALRLVPGNSDSERWFRGETLQRWGQIEAARRDFAQAEALFDLSETEYSTICFPPRKEEGLCNLTRARKASLPLPSPHSAEVKPEGAELND